MSPFPLFNITQCESVRLHQVKITKASPCVNALFSHDAQTETSAASYCSNRKDLTLHLLHPLLVVVLRQKEAFRCASTSAHVWQTLRSNVPSEE